MRLRILTLDVEVQVPHNVMRRCHYAMLNSQIPQLAVSHRPFVPMPHEPPTDVLEPTVSRIDHPGNDLREAMIALRRVNVIRFEHVDGLREAVADVENE
jgi:hypothetical protein